MDEGRWLGMNIPALDEVFRREPNLVTKREWQVFMRTTQQFNKRQRAAHMLVGGRSPRVFHDEAKAWERSMP
jgi:hypothetical protein